MIGLIMIDLIGDGDTYSSWCMYLHTAIDLINAAPTTTSIDLLVILYTDFALILH